MENKISFVCYGEPTAKGRARFYVRGGFARAYTPKETRDAEGDFRTQALKYRPKELITTAITLTVWVFRSIPKSFSKKKAALAETGEIKPITRPDKDNYEKLVCDALNSVFWKDDSQICDGDTHKRYSTTPRVEVSLTYEETK